VRVAFSGEYTRFDNLEESEFGPVGDDPSPAF
jgi:hypothetical protein